MSSDVVTSVPADTPDTSDALLFAKDDTCVGQCAIFPSPLVDACRRLYCQEQSSTEATLENNTNDENTDGGIYQLILTMAGSGLSLISLVTMACVGACRCRRSHRTHGSYNARTGRVNGDRDDSNVWIDIDSLPPPIY